MAFIKLSIREPAPYGEVTHRQAYLNTGEMVEIAETRDSEGRTGSRILMRDGRTIEVGDRPEVIIRKIAGVEQ